MDDKDYNPFEDQAYLDSLDDQIQDLFDEYPDEWWEEQLSEYLRKTEGKSE